MEDHDLAVFQMRRNGLGNIPVRGRGQNDHDDFHLLDRFPNIGCDQSQLAKPMWTAFGTFQFDAAAFFDDFHMVGCAVEQINYKTHESQMRCHCLPTMSRPDHCIFFRHCILR